jgi:hypothetical protein|tara:strand:+ start:117 stop:362 length:246 start_codon:yes stop_codon:yes gene_type:complete
LLIIELFTQVVWLAAGLAVLGSVVLFFLTPLYEDWKFDKYQVDKESEVYELVIKSIGVAQETGTEVTITLKGDLSVETDQT